MRSNTKTLVNQNGKTCTIHFEPRVTVDSIDAVCELALVGLGLATPPAFLVEEDLQRGHLVEPLPQWRAESLPVYAVWPPNVAKESLTFRLIAFLELRKESYLRL
jgi:DNA-binding transcriptional LysR family regulator